MAVFAKGLSYVLESKKVDVMPNLFRHPSGHSRLPGLKYACSALFYRLPSGGMPKQVQHDEVIFLKAISLGLL